jgi:DNA-binding transcriptional LysR family regulator
MTRRNVGWELYRSFLAVLQEGSLSGAARSLGITQPTAGRHVAALEAQLGLALFTRSQTGLLPTDAALALRGHAEAMHSTAAALERAADSHGEGVQGTVRISASEVVGVEVLPPLLARLRRLHPLLTVELVLSNRVQDLLQREADIAVRMDAAEAGRAGRAACRRHGDRPLCPPRLPRRARHPAHPADLQDHALVGFDADTPYLRRARQSFPTWNRDAFALRCDSDLGQLALVRAGCGIGVCQVAVAARDRSLVRVLPRQVQITLDTWVVMHRDLRGSPRCRATFDALVKGLASARGSASTPP